MELGQDMKHLWVSKGEEGQPVLVVPQLAQLLDWAELEVQLEWVVVLFLLLQSTYKVREK
jgi:hypothetical protein